MHEQLTTSDEAHNEENLLWGLEYISHSDEIGVIGLEQNVFFQFGGLNLVVLDNHVFSQRLHGIHILSAPLYDQKDFTERASSNN